MAFKGDGPEVTNLNANNLTSGTVAAARGGTGLSSVGTAGNVLTSTGTAWVSSAPAAGGGRLLVDVFAASGTWTAPTGVTRVKVTVVGGGGGAQTSGFYGGNGGIAIGVYTVTPGANYTVTVGGGGASSTNGTAGGTTSFGSTLISVSGGGGATNSGHGAVGTSTLGNIFNTAPTPSGVRNTGSLDSFGGLVGSANREYGNNYDDYSSPIAWSISSYWIPGARGYRYAVGCGWKASGGVGGAVFIEYIAP